MYNSIFQLEGLTCFACERLVEKAIRRIEGVTAVSILRGEKSASAKITADHEITEQELQTVLLGSGFSII